MKQMKRILTIMIVVMMVISMLSVTAYADELPSVYEETDSYVIYYGMDKGKVIGTNPTPYQAKLTYDVVSDEPADEYVSAIAMYNTAAEDEQILSVYCVDERTSVVFKTYYERRNLEDATYFTEEAAGRLRSILRSGAPYVDHETLGEAAGVEGLKECEAILATQLAVWQTSYGDDMTINDPLFVVTREELNRYHSMYLADTYNNLNEDICEAEYQAYVAMSDEEKAAAEKRVVDTFNYLMSLEGTKPAAKVVSADSFVDWSKMAVANEDGTYNVVANATVDVSMTGTDAMTLSLVLADGTYVSTELNNGRNEYVLTMENVSEEIAMDAVTLAIDGTQTADDVFLFAPKGNRNTAQSMVGLCDDQLPVHAEVSGADRIVTIHKTNDKAPLVGLENITFDFYYVCTVDAYLSNDVILGTGVVTIDGKDYFSAPTEADMNEYVIGTTPVVSVITDANGDAVHNFGTDNDGIYLVVERDNPAIEVVANPFFVAIPGGAEADSGLCSIKIQPKNTVKNEDIEIEKDVTSIDNEHSSYDVGQEHSWIIQSSIPSGIGSGLKYEVRDTLDERLTLVGIARVALAKDAGSFGSSEAEGYMKDADETPAFDEAEIVLTEDVHYTVTVADDNSGFVMALTPDGMTYVAQNVGEAYGDYEIRTYFTAVINTNADMGECIPNQAHVDYTNNVGTDYNADSDIPEVHTGGITLVKVDASNGQRLAGAKFTLNVLNEDGTYTPVAFYSNAAMTGEKVTEVVTDGSGNAVFYGLAYGTYYLIETEAPEGYNLLTEPVEVTIGANTHLTENAVTVKNSAEFRLPETGGIGTAIFTFGGIGIIGAAALILLGGKKKK